jgi:hypothetical protein
MHALLGGCEALGLHVQSYAIDPVTRPSVKQIHMRLQKIHTHCCFVVAELLDQPSVPASSNKTAQTLSAAGVVLQRTHLWVRR